MPGIHNLPDTQLADLRARLRRIEGQAKGIQKMIDDDRDCIQVMDQLASIKAAVNGLSAEMLGAFALHCMRNPAEFPSPEQAVEQAVQALVRAGR